METGQKLMAIANNTSEKIVQKSLSIQISLNGLSFCVLDTDSQIVTHLNRINFDKRVTPFKLLDILKDQYTTEIALQQNFKSVQVVHVSELATIVPKSLFDKDNLADYLKFNSKILKSDFIAYDTIETNNSISVYVPYINVNNFIYDQFGSFTYQHVSTILINQILNVEKHSKEVLFYLHVYEGYFQTILVDHGALKLYNAFEFNSKEDFIYYVLFTIEQLQLDPETVKLVLIGDIYEHDELYSILYKYIRYVEFGKRFDNFTYQSEPKTKYSDFTLIHSF